MHAAEMVDRGRLVETFLNLVRIDSPSGHEQAIGEELLRRLQVLGCDILQDKAGNVIAEFPGEGNETVLLSCHMDTVGTDTGIKPVVRDGVIYSDGTTILGSDDKSGIAMVLETLRLLKDHPEWHHPPLEVVISVGEETGLRGSRQMDLSQLRAS